MEKGKSPEEKLQELEELVGELWMTIHSRSPLIETEMAAERVIEAAKAVVQAVIDRGGWHEDD